MIHLSGLALEAAVAKVRDRNRTLGLGLAERVSAAGAQQKLLLPRRRVVVVVVGGGGGGGLTSL